MRTGFGGDKKLYVGIQGTALYNVMLVKKPELVDKVNNGGIGCYENFWFF